MANVSLSSQLPRNNSEYDLPDSIVRRSRSGNASIDIELAATAMDLSGREVCNHFNRFNLSMKLEGGGGSYPREYIP